MPRIHKTSSGNTASTESTYKTRSQAGKKSDSKNTVQKSDPQTIYKNSSTGILENSNVQNKLQQRTQPREDSENDDSGSAIIHTRDDSYHHGYISSGYANCYYSAGDDTDDGADIAGDSTGITGDDFNDPSFHRHRAIWHIKLAAQARKAGSLYKACREYRQVAIAYEKAAGILKENKDHTGAAEAFRNAASALMKEVEILKQGRRDDSYINTLQRLINICEKAESAYQNNSTCMPLEMADVYIKEARATQALASYYKEHNDLSSAIMNLKDAAGAYEKAAGILEKNGGHAEAAEAWKNAAGILEENKDHTEAAKAYKEAFYKYKSINTREVKDDIQKFLNPSAKDSNADTTRASEKFHARCNNMKEIGRKLCKLYIRQLSSSDTAEKKAGIHLQLADARLMVSDSIMESGTEDRKEIETAIAYREAAISSCEMAVKNIDENKKVPVLVKLGALYRERGDLTGATGKYNEALKNNPDNKQKASILTGKADILYDEEKYEEALEKYKESLDEDDLEKEVESSALAGIADCSLRLSENGKNKFSIDTLDNRYDTALKNASSRKDLARIYTGTGELHLLKNRNDEAITFFDRAIGLNIPGTALARAYEKKGEAKQKLGQAASAVKSDENTPSEKSKLFKEATECFTKAGQKHMAIADSYMRYSGFRSGIPGMYGKACRLLKEAYGSFSLVTGESFENLFNSMKKLKENIRISISNFKTPAKTDKTDRDVKELIKSVRELEEDIKDIEKKIPEKTPYN